jgi:hypothetical protein
VGREVKGAQRDLSDVSRIRDPNLSPSTHLAPAAAARDRLRRGPRHAPGGQPGGAAASPVGRRLRGPGAEGDAEAHGCQPARRPGCGGHGEVAADKEGGPRRWSRGQPASSSLRDEGPGDGHAGHCHRSFDPRGAADLVAEDVPVGQPVSKRRRLRGKQTVSTHLPATADRTTHACGGANSVHAQPCGNSDSGGPWRSTTSTWHRLPRDRHGHELPEHVDRGGNAASTRRDAGSLERVRARGRPPEVVGQHAADR